jgi:site-specific DNA recombinase
MLADAETGAFDAIVVHKLDRFSRNLRITLETLERLDKSGVGFVSLPEDMDFTTPIGKVILATPAAFAQYYSDNLSQETKKGKAERKRQGLCNGLLPFGLKKGPDGLPVPHPA